MADEKDRKIDVYKPARPQGGPQRRPDILRAKDIIPGGGGEKNSQIDVPQFDLAEDIMAEQRRLIAIRRKGPGGPVRLSSPVSRPSPTESRWLTDDGRETQLVEWDPIIVDIVARDIERLCAGGSWT